ncbi:MAG: hypothetical protein KAQ84_01000 [Thermoplasmatales archaeon]|nr:hypothetical protein [Thermoplasmatales archaeon]
MRCPKCKGVSISTYGKQRYICKKCKTTFTEASSKGYPPTTFPFELIAFILYQWDVGTLDEITDYANTIIELLHTFNHVPKSKVSRSTIRKWKVQYRNNLSKLITRTEATTWVQKIISESFPRKKHTPPPEEEVEIVKVAEKVNGLVKDHSQDLQLLQEWLGKKEFNKLIKDTEKTNQLIRLLMKPRNEIREEYRRTFKKEQ